ncbi:MAG: OmpA family protein [Deltaproteobacteria bacterium]|nr:OmpA family protein [Deltaproteobacteria bacterium]
MGRRLRRGPGSLISREPGCGEGWMVTLSDMLLLLLTFFVLLISMSSFDKDLLRKAFGGLLPASSGVLHRGSSLNLDVPVEEVDGLLRLRDQNHYEKLSEPLSRLLDQLEDQLGKTGLAVEVVDQGLRLELASDQLFGTLDDDLKSQGKVALRHLEKFFRAWAGLIEIEVYTDNFPLQTARFPDNKVLAAGRGGRLTEYLVHAGFKPERFSLAAYGSDRGLVANDTPEHRRRNRRVVFHLPEWVAATGGKK